MSGDLISRKTLLKEMNDFSFEIGGSANAMALVVMDKTKKSISKLIENQPTAFDLESAIEQIKDKGTKICCSVKCDNNCENCEHGILMKSIIEILKSAANATNGKNGG